MSIVLPLAMIHKQAVKQARKFRRGASLEQGDLENEAVLHMLQGRKSIVGPMLDLMRQQGLVGNHRKSKLVGVDEEGNPRMHVNPVRAPMPEQVSPSFETTVIKKVDGKRAMARISKKEARAAEECVNCGHHNRHHIGAECLFASAANGRQCRCAKFIPGLTKKELETIKAYATGGGSRKHGAQFLGITVHLMNWRCERIMKKLGTHNFLEIVLTCLRLGFIGMDDLPKPKWMVGRLEDK